MKGLLTIGTFDGVHRGHRALVRRLVAEASRHRLLPHVVLFKRPPRFFFQPAAATPLMTTVAERTALLRELGVRRVTALDFDAAWARVPHERFFRDFLLRRCRAGGLLVGPDFAFGKGRLGTTSWLRRVCSEEGLLFRIQPIVAERAAKLSSSTIRRALLAGDVATARRHLGRPYRLDGLVVRGRGLGGKIGVPTANLEVSPERILPRGVFKVRVEGPASLAGGCVGVCNIGTRPTVDRGPRVHVEVHIPGFSASLYGRRLTVDFLRRLRGERRFPTIRALIAQIRRDIRAARA
ncbi:MAG: riboflavin biosynthesis protein RibF [Elusimicrobia bacterium]|nr:riboflavin biosynthesis protein RibF [Elusimicrobiota bacterium]